jgi:hypothetical protein
LVRLKTAAQPSPAQPSPALAKAKAKAIKILAPLERDGAGLDGADRGRPVAHVVHAGIDETGYRHAGLGQRGRRQQGELRPRAYGGVTKEITRHGTERIGGKPIKLPSRVAAMGGMLSPHPHAEVLLGHAHAVA